MEQDTDVAQRLLDEYLEHVERQRNVSAGDENDVGLDVLQYRRHVLRPVDADTSPAGLP